VNPAYSNSVPAGMIDEIAAEVDGFSRRTFAFTIVLTRIAV
jgi:hypothetical protein